MSLELSSYFQINQKQEKDPQLEKLKVRYNFAAIQGGAKIVESTNGFISKQILEDNKEV